MNRIVAILSVVGVLFVGLVAASIQLTNHNESANPEIIDGITGIANVSFVVLAAVGIFVGGVIVLFAVIAAMGGR